MTASGHYHCSVKSVGRGNGASVMAKAAYRSGECLYDARTGEFFDYSRRHGVIDAYLELPDHTPIYTREQLWNEADRADDRSNARIATELELALPHELTEGQRRELLLDFVRGFVGKYGVAADVAIHEAHDKRNKHAHVLLSHRVLSSHRALGSEGFADIANTRTTTRKRKGEMVQEKVAGIAATPADIKAIRRDWEQHVNRAYERAGLDIRVDHRSHAERGIEAEPTKHLGPKAAAMERDGRPSDRGDINREIDERNRDRRLQTILEADAREIDATITQVHAALAEAEQRRAAIGRYDDVRAAQEGRETQQRQRPATTRAEAERSTGGPEIGREGDSGARRDEPEKSAAKRDERPLNRTQADIRIAWTLSRSREELSAALAARNIALARVNPDEARASREQGELYRQQLREHEQWKARAVHSRYAALTPEPPRPRYAPVLKEGEIVAVDARGQVYRLDERTTGSARGEIEKRLAGLDAGGLMNIAGAKTAIGEAERAAREARQAQERIDAPVGKTAGDIRMAWTLSRSREELDEALAARGLTIARATAEEARASAFHREIGNRSPVFEAGELVVVNGYGNVYRFDERTTGNFLPQIDKRLAGLDAGSLMSVTDAKAAMLRDRQDRERPASGIENKIIECTEWARLQGATVRQNRNGEIISGVDALADQLKSENERQTHSATVHGNQAVAARIEQAGIAIVRVTADDVKSHDALRGEEEMERATAKDVRARKAQHFAKVKVGDIAAVTRAGNVYRLNRHRLDLAGLDSAISSTVPEAKRTSSVLPSVTQARGRFESEDQKKTALWDERRAASAASRTSLENSFARKRTMRRVATAAIGKPGETVNRSLKAAGKGAGIVGRGLGMLAGVAKWLDLFPAPPPSPEQQERNYYAAKEQQATDDLAAKKESSLQDILRQIARDDQERERQRRERGGYDDDYGRGRER